MNLFGQKTSVWIGLQSDDYGKWVNEHPKVYSNWLPVVEVVHVSFMKCVSWGGVVLYIIISDFFKRIGPDRASTWAYFCTS